MTTLDWSHCDAVESVPDKVSGAWVLRGTRMPVSAIVENIEAGASIDDIMNWFDGLDREQVRAVIEFAARSGDAVVFVAADEFHRLKGDRSGQAQAMIEALQASPHREIEVEPCRSPMPVRTVKL